MIILNLEVIDLDGAFQQLMLNFLYNHILAVDKNQYVAGTEVSGFRPALDWGVEGITGDFFTVYKNYIYLIFLYINDVIINSADKTYTRHIVIFAIPFL